MIYLSYRVIYLLKLNLVSYLYEINRNCLSSISNILHLFVELELILVSLLDAKGYFFFLSQFDLMFLINNSIVPINIIVLYSQLFSNKLEKLRKICWNLFTNIYIFFYQLFRTTYMIWLICSEQRIFIRDSHLKESL